jgi:N-acetylglucosamine kinase-like BadF-type ATPase
MPGLCALCVFAVKKSTMKQDYFLGVDGGNTKTIALVARDDGTIVGAGRGGCGDIYNSTPENALAAIDAAVNEALLQAQITTGQLRAGGFSMAGADWPADFDLLRTAMAARGYGTTQTVVNDAIGALWAGAADGYGVAVVCGTGIATGARARDGQLWHSSFWQEQAGAGHYGALTFRAICRAELGIDPPTQLRERALAAFDLPTVEALLERMTGRDSPLQWRFHGLARVLLDTAEAGDITARNIVLAEGHILGDYALAAARKVAIAHETYPLVLAGGVLRHPSALLRETIVSRVRAAHPLVHASISSVEPALGALMLTFASVGLPVEPERRKRITDSSPSVDFFAT